MDDDDAYMDYYTDGNRFLSDSDLDYDDEGSFMSNDNDSADEQPEPQGQLAIQWDGSEEKIEELPDIGEPGPEQEPAVTPVPDPESPVVSTRPRAKYSNSTSPILQTPRSFPNGHRLLETPKFDQKSNSRKSIGRELSGEVSDDDAMVSEQTEAHVAVHGLLELNRNYQEDLKKYIKKLGDKKSQIKQRMDTIKVELGSGGEELKVDKKVKLEKPHNFIQFMPPVFKDSAGLAPPPNQDVVLKSVRGERDPLVRPPKPWSTEEKTKLKEGVRQCLIEALLTPLVWKMDSLNERVQNAGAEYDRNEVELWKKQINDYRRRIRHIKKYKLRTLCEREHEQIEVDWIRIACSDVVIKGIPTRTADQCKAKWMNELSPKWLPVDFPWQKSELKKLVKYGDGLEKEKEGKSEHKLLSWDRIAVLVNHRRTAFQCFQKYTQIINSHKNRKWTLDEVKKLREAVRRVAREDGNSGPIRNWDAVAASIYGRSASQCRSRWMRTGFEDGDVKKGRWTQDEDLALATAVRRFGKKDWVRVAEMVPNRHAGQCRERWANVLDAKVKVGEWTAEEEWLWHQAVRKYGKGNWAKVSRCVPGRTPSACRIHWNSYVLGMDAPKPFRTKPKPNKPEPMSHKKRASLGMAVKFEKLRERRKMVGNLTED